MKLSKKTISAFGSACLLLMGSLVSISFNTNGFKQYQYGDYIEEKDSYFVKTVDGDLDRQKAHKLVKPSDSYYSTQKTRFLGSDIVGDMESVWDNYTGKGTTIAVIDDGFDVDHPEYIRQDGTSAILSTSRSYYLSGSYVYYQSYSSNPDCIKESYDGGWDKHGTQTSTTALAPMNNGGGVGIAPDANLLALKIDFSFAAINSAIDYAISQKVDVINLSLGAYAESFYDAFNDYQEGSSSVADYFESVCTKAYNNGIIVVAAAGNEATWHKSYPACNYKVIGVGASGNNNDKGDPTSLAEFTNYNGSSQTGELNVDIIAPGYSFTATQEGTQDSIKHSYGDTQGTSFSCPVVAGAAALWKEKYPEGTPDEFLEQLQSTADYIGDYENKNIPASGWDYRVSDVGPSNITQGHINIYNLLDVSTPYVSTKQSSISISVGETKQIELESYSGVISYASSNTNIATVTSGGLVRGIEAGDTQIVVTATKNGETDTAVIDVHVAAAVASTSLTFDPDTHSMSVGETFSCEQLITLTPANASRIFLFESDDETVAIVDIDTGFVTAHSIGTANITAISGYGEGDDVLTITVTESQTYSGLIEFGNTDGKVKVSSANVTGVDNLNNTWAVTTTGTTSFTANSEYYQIGSSKNPATSITFSMELDSTVVFKEVSASFGGFSGSSGDVVIKVDDTTIGTGSVVASTDTTTSNTSTASGTTLTISITNISKGIKAYNISYSYAGESTSVDTPTVSGVTITPSSLNLDLYNNTTGTLTAVVEGSNSPSQEVTWRSSDSSIASVSNGVVTAHQTGDVTITATSTQDTSKSGTCVVSVSDSTPKTLSSIAISGYKTSLNLNEAFDFGGTVTATFSDGSTQDVTSDATFAGYNMSSVGTYTVTVTYTYGSNSETASYQLSVVEPTSNDPSTSSTFTIGWGAASGESGTHQNFSATNGSVDNILSFSCNQNNAPNAPAYNSNSSELRLYYNASGNGCSINITPSEGVIITSFVMTTSTYPSVKYTVDGGSATTITGNSNSNYVSGDFSCTSSLIIQNANTTNTQLRIKTISLTYQTVAPSEKIISSLSATYNGSVFVGDELDLSKMTVTASFTDTNTYKNEIIPNTDYSLSNFNSSAVGTSTVTITYTGELSCSHSPMTTTIDINVVEKSIKDISINCGRTYHPGELLTKDDIIFVINYQNGDSDIITDFTLVNEGYMFKYDDTLPGGNANTKQFNVIFNDTTYTVDVNVTRETPITASTYTETLNHDTTGATDGSSSYEEWTYTNNNVTYLGQSAASYNTIQLRSKEPSGIVITNSDKNVKEIQIEWNSNTLNGRTLQIFGSDVPYTSYSDLFETNSSGTLLGSLVYSGTNQSSFTINGSYKYIGLRSENGALYLDEVSFVYGGQETAKNVSNYIMYEDTTNQCLTKLDVAIDKLNNLSQTEKDLFWTSSDYVIATARNRLTKWAIHEHLVLSYSNGEFSVASRSLFTTINEQNGNTIPLFIALTVLIIPTIYILKRKTSNN